MSLKDLVEKSPAQSKRRALQTGDILDNTPHRMFGLPSLVEGMIPAKTKVIPAQSVNAPKSVSDMSAEQKAARAKANMRRRNQATLLSGQVAATDDYSATPGLG